MTAADLYAKANDAYFDDDYDEALDLFSQALSLEPENPEFLLKRCVVFQKLKKFDNALADATAAQKHLLANQGARSLLARANLQLGIVLHQLGRYSEAQSHFQNAQELNPNEKTLVTWMRKNQDKLPAPTAQANVSTPQATSDGSTPSVSQPASVTPQAVRVRHEWFQNDNFITVEVFIKKVKAEAVTVEFFDRTMSLTIKMPSGSDYVLELDPLAHEILPKESSFKVLTTKVEIKMKKKMAGIMWGALESDNDQGIAISTTAPTSAKKPKDWNALVRDIEKEQEKPEGDAALNALFQQIYSNADDDTKRAMMKSYIESNGTCLSTNWAEVGAGKVETRPPEGMEAKKYEF